MASNLVFTDDEMAVDDGVGYPKAYAKLCRDRSFSPYSNGPPFTFTPYALPQLEASRAMEFDELFPIIDPQAKPTTKPKLFISLLWKQLNHLGNAGFDPETFRVDPYGNVLYYHADPASPLAWDIDHWFPRSRGGLTVPSNLRILQWQVCKKKNNKLEFLIPWWDFQLGVSINQFLSIFASSNSDFRRRAFSWLFAEGESEELNASQTVDSHAFPQHFMESKEKIGLAPAAVVLSRRESHDAASSALKSLDLNRRPRSSTPIIAAKKMKSSVLKENEDPSMISNPYQAIVQARDSLRQKEETTKMQAELQKLDDEVNELKRKTEEEKDTIQDLELLLIKRRRRAEKCRRLAEAQSSYRSMLEKMIRDAMHQSVVYKEQVRLNQAAANALMARLEAQKAICDSSEKELHKKFKQRDDLEKQIRPEWEQARKRSRMNDCLPNGKDDEDEAILYLPETKPQTQQQKDLIENSVASGARNAIMSLPSLKLQAPLHKELRVFLEEEQKASEAALSSIEEQDQSAQKQATLVAGEEISNVESTHKLEIQEGGTVYNIQFPVIRDPESEEDDESRKQRGKGNIEKWLQMLFDDTQDVVDPPNAEVNENNRTDEIIRDLNFTYPRREIITSSTQESQKTEGAKLQENEVQKKLIPGKDGKKEEEILEIRARRKSFSNKSETVGWTTKETFEIKARKSLSSKPEKQGQRNQDVIKIHPRSSTPLKNPPYRLPSEKSNGNEVGSIKGEQSTSSFERNETKEITGKEKEFFRSESARAFRRIPSSPSLILSGMKKRVDCIGKKPLVVGDDDDDSTENHAAGNNFIKSSIKTIKRAINI